MNRSTYASLVMPYLFHGCRSTRRRKEKKNSTILGGISYLATRQLHGNSQCTAIASGTWAYRVVPHAQIG
eukprot:6465604-Amphidinium_carterae.1